MSQSSAVSVPLTEVNCWGFVLSQSVGKGVSNMAEAVRWRKHAHPPEVEFIDAVPEDRSSQINSEVCKATLSAEYTKAVKMTQKNCKMTLF